MKKDQFIIVCADSADSAKVLMPTAHLFAEKLCKGIILLSCTPGAEAWIERFGVPFMALKSDWKTAIDNLPTAMNAVLAITLSNPKASRSSITHPRTLLKTFRDCKIAYLVCCGECIVGSTREQIPPTTHFPLPTFLTIDHQRESKEKLIWASYMARFFGSTVTILHRNYRDAAFRMRWHNNMRYLDKIFSSLNLTYETAVLEGGSEFGNPDLLAIKQLSPFTSHLSPLFIALVPDRRDRDLGDLFSTPAELRLIKNSAHLPILLLNQRDDLYVLCD